MGGVDDFGTAVVRAELPPWFYSAWSIAGLAPLVKAQLSPEQVRAGREVDVRPVAVGEVDLRAIASYLARDCREASVAVLAPQQLAVGVSGGISILIHGIRMMLEQHHNFIVVKIDMKNAFNSVSRAVVLRRMAAHPRLAHLVPFMHATGASPADLYVGGERLFRGRCLPAPRDSSHGGLVSAPWPSLFHR